MTETPLRGIILYQDGILMVKKIMLLTTGGTIASENTVDGFVPSMPPDQILRYVPEVKTFCDVTALQIMNIDSSNVQPENWLLISRAIQDHYDAFDGFVITHGTDTMAYAASALSYLIQNPAKPIVLTGAQKPIHQGDSDARRNVIHSFWFCAEARTGGVFLCFDGKVFVGTRASKVKSKSYDAFESINFPAVAYVHYRHPLSRIHLGGPASKPVRFFDEIDPSVFLLKLIPGMEPEILEYVGQRYTAIVIESYGLGGLPFADQRNFLKQVESLVSCGKILVVATQVKNEGSDLSIYEVGIRSIQRVPLLQSMDMTIEAVVTKLMWILPQTKVFKEVEKLFYTPVNEDISIFPEGKFRP
ncbi:MAG: asparaginase [Treponema sp.]|nr:asparaginase [Treponema sp.]